MSPETLAEASQPTRRRDTPRGFDVAFSLELKISLIPASDSSVSGFMLDDFKDVPRTDWLAAVEATRYLALVLLVLDVIK